MSKEALDKMAENARMLGLDYEPTQEPCGGCGGSGWVTRDPDIGTDQECFVCGGSGAYPKEQEQEPVACQYQNRDGVWKDFISEKHYKDTLEDGSWPIRNLYTSPQAQRKPLTDEQIDRLWSQSLADTKGETYLPLREFARAIEAAHGIKENT